MQFFFPNSFQFEVIISGNWLFQADFLSYTLITSEWSIISNVILRILMNYMMSDHKKNRLQYIGLLL